MGRELPRRAGRGGAWSASPSRGRRKGPAVGSGSVAYSLRSAGAFGEPAAVSLRRDRQMLLGFSSRVSCQTGEPWELSE